MEVSVQLAEMLLKRLLHRGAAYSVAAVFFSFAGAAGLTIGNEEGHNEFEDFLVGHIFYVGRLWGRVLCVDGGGGTGGEAGFGAAVGGAVVSAELVALPAAVAKGQREGRAVVDVVVAEFVVVGPAAFVAVGQLVVDGDRFFHDVPGGGPVFLPCAGAGEVFDGAPAFDQSVVVFAEWAVCCVAVAAVVAQVLIWHSRSLLLFACRAEPAGGADRFLPGASPGRELSGPAMPRLGGGGPWRYLPLTGDTIPIAIEFRLVASVVSSHIAHAHVVGLGTVSRAGLSRRRCRRWRRRGRARVGELHGRAAAGGQHPSRNCRLRLVH